MKYLGVFLCGAVLGVSAWILLHNLAAGPLARYDEGTYAQVVHESFQRHDFLTFTYLGNQFFDKPPLYFWLAGAATWIAHDPVLGIRLPAALAALATIGLVMYIAYKTTYEWWVPILSGAYLLSVEPFIQGARLSRFDVLIGFFILLAFWFAWEKKYIGFAICVALSILTKSVVAVFAAAALPLISLWRWDWNWIADKRFWVGVSAALCLTAPWHLYEWARFGNEFWYSYIGVNVLERYQSNLFANPALQTDYIGRLLDYARPQLVLFLLSLISTAVVWRRSDLAAALGTIATVMALIVLVFFTAQTRALSYLLPLYPFAALFFGLSASLLFQRLRDTLRYDTDHVYGSSS